MSRSRLFEKSQEQKEKEEIAVVELRDIEKSYALVSAQIKLAQRNAKFSSQSTETLRSFSSGLIFLLAMPAEDTVSLLAESGLYDQAVSLARLFDISLKTIVEIITKKCLLTYNAPMYVYFIYF